MYQIPMDEKHKQKKNKKVYSLVGRDIRERQEIVPNRTKRCEYLRERRNDEILSMTVKRKTNSHSPSR